MIAPTQECPDSVEYLRKLRGRLEQHHIPTSGAIEITQCCNLRCIHCYLGDQKAIRSHKQRELSTAQWIKIIKDVADAGCLTLLITGGEPLLRKDFDEIYTFAKKQGLLVTVFTNAVLITDEIIELLKKLPPFSVEVSLYGATRSVYEKITGVKGSYAQCIEGIDRLAANVHLVLKTVLMTVNRHELAQLKILAKQYGAKFRFDTAVFPCYNGDASPIKYRLTPKQAVSCELADEESRREWVDFYHARSLPASDDALYQCGAGRWAFNIDAYGRMYPCQKIRGINYDLLNGSFREGWPSFFPVIRAKKAPKDFVCKTCDKKALCNYCPAFALIEHGRDDVLPEYQCKIGHQRYKLIKSIERRSYEYNPE